LEADLALQLAVAGAQVPEGYDPGVALPQGMQSQRGAGEPTRSLLVRAGTGPVAMACSTRYVRPSTSTNILPTKLHVGRLPVCPPTAKIKESITSTVILSEAKHGDENALRNMAERPKDSWAECSRRERVVVAHARKD